MDKTTIAIRRIIFFGIVLGLMVGIGFAVKKLVLPKIQESRVAQTSSQVNYKTNIRMGLDSFAGYAVLRSPNFRDQLGRQEIGIQLVDDKADYPSRMKALAKGELDMAVYTVDTFISTGVDFGSFPATMTLIIDESHKADGIVAYKQAVPNAQALNRPDAKFVATGNSPSETLARHLIANMLPAVAGQKWLIETDNVDKVLEQLKKANKNDLTAYVLWEPALSKALTIPGVVSIYDTGKVSSIIVDVLVVNRKYAIDHPDTVRAIEEAYFRSLHFYTNAQGGMAQLVFDDAKLVGEPVTEAQAKAIADGIIWKNTLENYAQMGLLSSADLHGLPMMREIITSISQFLLKTGKISQNPTEGHEVELFDNKILREMQNANFHPGQTQENVRGVSALPALSEAEWKTLLTVGNMDARSISFGRGSAALEVQAKRDVEDVAGRLKAWPTYYLTVIGHARSDGDAAANLALAKSRAQSVVDELITLGVDKTRLRPDAEPFQTQSGTAQSVTFTLSQRPY